MKSLISSLLFFLLFFSNSIIYAQELPPINNFAPKNYNGESQNWSISQSKDGKLYVANNLGLLEFNGAEWELYKTPNATIMRSVNVIEDKIFTGFYMDFGYWLRDEFGTLNYFSLVNSFKIPLLEDEQFWNIIEFEDWILFQSLQRIYLYNTKTDEIQIINSDVKITKMFHVKDDIYYQKLGKGLYKIDKGNSVLVSDSTLFKNEDIINIHYINEELLVLTNLSGFIKLKENTVSFWSEANENLKNNKVYNSTQLSNGDFAIGTISNGVMFLNADGLLKYKISQINGLNNNTVLSLFEDVNGTVWLGLDNGISSVDINSNIKIFKEKKGAIGAVYATKILNNYFYLGTNQGLFVKRYNSKESFRLIEGTQGQVWSLNDFDDLLFCGHDSGTFIINGKEIINKINIQGTWDIKRITENKLLQGNYSGLYLLEKNNKKWRLKNKIHGFNNSSRSFEFLSENQLFINHEYKGIFKLTLNKQFNKVVSIAKDTVIGKGFHSNIIKYKKNIYYADNKGVFKYQNSTKHFVKDSVLSNLYSEENYTTGKMVYDSNSDILWSFSKKYISYIKPNTINQKLDIKRISISEDLRKSVQGFENMSIYKGDEILGINNGFIRLNYTNLDQTPIDYPIAINTITVNELDKERVKVALDKENEFSDLENNFEFKYNVPYLTKDANVEYQYILEGYKTSWSTWQTKPMSTFENLPKGVDYTFKVRAKIGDILTSNIATYTFSIKNPWYLTNIAIGLYITSFLFFLFTLDKTYKTYYRRQRKRLLEKQEKDFRLQSLANEKELIQAKNDQLKIDVESKSRELATSTMSIIKKNELLSTIKNELKVGGENGVKSVVKIIDKNLNNTDDWQVFKEAFNNADKDFIKKLKEIHTSLTPNDLRLCAYLRLNLSSKEIAPLLNISPRSVEVKRYRLRKKMNLEHNDSLTDYILNI